MTRFSTLDVLKIVENKQFPDSPPEKGLNTEN
jgi:hypothetical protein